MSHRGRTLEVDEIGEGERGRIDVRVVQDLPWSRLDCEHRLPGGVHGQIGADGGCMRAELLDESWVVTVATPVARHRHRGVNPMEPVEDLDVSRELRHPCGLANRLAPDAIGTAAAIPTLKDLQQQWLH